MDFAAPFLHALRTAQVVADDEPGFFENLDVLGDAGLSQSERNAQLVDIHVSLAEHFHDPCP